MPFGIFWDIGIRALLLRAGILHSGAMKAKPKRTESVRRARDMDGLGETGMTRMEGTPPVTPSTSRIASTQVCRRCWGAGFYTW